MVALLGEGFSREMIFAKVKLIIKELTIICEIEFAI
jgi:hypothetical protein